MQNNYTKEPTISLAMELISKKSITPDDANCQQLMIDYLENLGFETTKLRFDDVDNFFAIKYGTAKNKTFMFAGHTDVVPPGDKNLWKTEPFAPTIKKDILYGRGAADMKGSLAAMLVATSDFIKQNPDHKENIAFLITSDEEGVAINGTIKVCEYLVENNINIDYSLVGEPSSTSFLGDVVKNGRRGSLNGFLTIIGKQGHIAYPHLADNPIHLASNFLAELTQIKWDEGTKYFEPTSLQISNINSGTGATNIIPASLELIFNFRYNTNYIYTDLIKKVEDLLQKHNLEYKLEWQHSGASFITENSRLIDATISSCKEILDIDTKISTGGGTSDGRFIAPMLNSQVIELGPINKTIHQVNECVNIKDLVNLTKVYNSILTKLVK